MNTFKGRLFLYLIAGIPIPLLIFLVYGSTQGFVFTAGVAVIGIGVEVVYKVKGWD